MKQAYLCLSMGIFLFFCCISAQAQVSVQDLGIKTNYKITSNNVVLSQDQLLVKKSTQNIAIQSGYEDRYPVNQSYNWYILEFKTSGKILSIKDVDRNNIFSMKFFKDDKLLMDVVSTPSDISILKSKIIKGTEYYSIDLFKVPLVLLQEADRIDLVIFY